ncbi:class E sortase [Streptomyces sp. NPDC051018]|uniref:class E sortase n=1 Tax=Streptomyces sp. NPDC051018 TaxID=3365639 RepID=UPI0037B1ADDB
MRERIPVVVQGRGPRRRERLARGLWAAAEITVTLGIVVLLLVVHQLWWTNREAREGAGEQVRALEREWGEQAPEGETPLREIPAAPEDGGTGEESARGDGGRGEAGAGQRAGDAPGGGNTARRAPRPPRWDQAYAILRIPRLGVVAPVAEGVGKKGVLDKGYVGHYPGTAQPGRAGNVALAGHRNTHGEPFRYINRLRAGDDIHVETRDAIYLYEVDKALGRTSPRDTGVIKPVPRSLVTPSAGYGEPGYYLTLTTCTPEYSSRYRLIVWGKLKSMEAR